MVGDVKHVLRQMLNAGVRRKPGNWFEQVRKVADAPDSRLNMPEDELNPQTAISAVRARLQDDDVIATDVGQHQLWTAQYYV